MKRVLITGASGFIGSFLVEETLKRAYEVSAGIRKLSSRKYLSDKAIHFELLDLSSKGKLTSFFQQKPRYDFIIHAAGIIKTCDKSNFDTVNFLYTKNLIESLYAARKIPSKFLFISSLATMGPGNEGTLTPVKLSDIPHPVTLYGKSKLRAEQFIQSLSGFPYIILRPTGVYGPREKDYYLAFKSIQNHIETYVGAKEQRLTFLHVSDLSRLAFDALESPVKNKIYFVTDLKRYTAVQFNGLIKKILRKKTIIIVFPKFFIRWIIYFNEKISCFFGKPATLNSDKYNELISKNWLCETNEIVNDFGFQPQYNLEKGLYKTLKWYKKEKWL